MLQRTKPFIIGVAGGTASGKTTVCRQIIQKLNNLGLLKMNTEIGVTDNVVIISQDNFYKGLNDEQKSHPGDYNFDAPDAFDFELMIKIFQDIKDGKTVEIPIYDYSTHSRTNKTHVIVPASVVLFEGILVTYEKGLRELMDMKLFVEADPDIRLARRILRDMAERGRDVGGIIMQYLNTVKPSFENFTQPTKKYADIIIPNDNENTVAIELIVRHIEMKLKDRKKAVDH